MIKAGYNHLRIIMGAGEPNHSPRNHELSHNTLGGAASIELLTDSGHSLRVFCSNNRCISGCQLRVIHQVHCASSSVHAEGNFRVPIVKAVCNYECSLSAE